MKKYSDWQKYVKEQIDRAGTGAPAEQQPRTPDAAPRPVEKKDDGFIIRRKDQPAAQTTAAKPGPAFPPHPVAKSAAASQQPQPPKPQPPQPSADEQRLQQELFARDAAQRAAAEEPARPIASPFVSVNEIWKAAEKSSRAPQPQRPPEPRRAAPPPRAEAPARTEPARTPAETKPPAAPDATSRKPVQQTPAFIPDDISPEAARAQRGQSREEIIERLVNPTISLEEAAKIMGVCKATVRRYTAMGILPHYRTPGNQRRFKLNDIILFLENQKK